MAITISKISKDGLTAGGLSKQDIDKIMAFERKVGLAGEKTKFKFKEGKIR